MTVTEAALEYRRLRAPREDFGVFIDPPAFELAERLAANMQHRGTGRDPAAITDGGYDCQGRSLSDLAVQIGFCSRRRRRTP